MASSAQLRLMSDLKAIINEHLEGCSASPLSDDNLFSCGAQPFSGLTRPPGKSLLTDPNPVSPANPEAAQLHQHDIQAYNKRVRRCARRSTECS